MLLAILLVIDILLVICFAFVPYYTRATELFGVTLPAEHSRDPELRRLRASYRNLMLALGALLLALSTWLGLSQPADSLPAMILYLITVLFYLVAGFLVYLPKHFAMKRIKRERGWDVVPVDKTVVALADTAPPARDVVSAAWLLLLPLVILLTLAAVWLVWPQVPDVVPTHYGLNGVADAFTQKGPAAVLPLVVTQVFLAAIIAFAYFVVRRTRRQIDADDPQGSRTRDLRFRRLTSGSIVGMGVLVELLIGTLMLMSLTAVGEVGLVLVPALVVLIIISVGIVFFTSRVGQGGSRLREPVHNKATRAAAVNIDDDRFWLLGQFYFNPADPAVFVEKRFGLGYTCNFARPATWLLVGGLLVLTTGTLVAVFVLAG
ncbi:MAG: DUF5808 domain-containing protein [Coriobacteriales bacterium]|nr:DUF5808 domain-containing protein [Coriobacteriales bacterium]